VTRLAPTLIVLVLLAATAVAFGVTERLKLEQPPIAGPEATKVFSPVCDCAEERARIGFRLRERDTISVSIVDEEGDVVRRLVVRERRPAGSFGAAWDGRDEAGNVVAEGVYRPRLRLEDDRRVIVLQTPIRVDTTPPRVLGVAHQPVRFSPDGDGRNDKVSVRYRFSERAHGLLFLGERRVVRTRGQRAEDKLDWHGRVEKRALPAGTYSFTLAAEDTAGNLSEGRRFTATIRYVELSRPSIRASVRTRFGVRVLTDAASIRWRFAGGSGRARPGLLVLRAPRRAGRYTLFVEANGHAARADVRVTPRPARASG
jgi:FlgD Ig-like domain